MLVLSLLSLAVGAIAGIVGAIFRVLLEQADRARDTLVAWAHGQETVGLLFVVGMSAFSVALAAG